MSDQQQAGKQHLFQPPKGTRDFYPLEMARRRWIEKKWRDVSLRHGFEEIDGPTFEHLDLYTVKSGEGIVNELFSFQRAGGERTFALRPEFTPTLARMYAARANSLTKPTKWFTYGSYFRAERPQRGRLREFVQWNVDFIGEDSVEADAEVIGCCVGLLEEVGLTPSDIRIRLSNRDVIEEVLQARCGVKEEDVGGVFALLDKRSKLSEEEFDQKAKEVGFDVSAFDAFARAPTQRGLTETSFGALWEQIESSHLKEWCEADFSVVRGLAYYTGTVFEVEVDGERAVAGGGRYDRLIEMFGGPSTPAVGFAMGDVVLALVLQEKGLMASDEELLEELGARPDVFVIPSPDVEMQVAGQVVARLRRWGLHARRSYKTTRNVGKLLKDANNQLAKLAVILEGDGMRKVKDLENGEQREGIGEDELLGVVNQMLGEREEG